MKRRHGWALAFCLIAGCSTHPLVDFCDYFKPGKLGSTTVTPYGGVAIPQGPILPASPAFPGAPVIPPAAPLPGNRPPGFQLQPPTPGEFPPLPPSPPPKF